MMGCVVFSTNVWSLSTAQSIDDDRRSIGDGNDESQKYDT